MTLTIRLNDALTITIWPKWARVAIVTPVQAMTLSLREFEKALRVAKRRIIQGGGE